MKKKKAVVFGLLVMFMLSLVSVVLADCVIPPACTSMPADKAAKIVAEKKGGKIATIYHFPAH